MEIPTCRSAARRSPCCGRVNRVVQDTLPFADRQDFEDAQRGFFGSLPKVEIKNPQGAWCGVSGSTPSSPTSRRRPPSISVCGAGPGSTCTTASSRAAAGR